MTQPIAESANHQRMDISLIAATAAVEAEQLAKNKEFSCENLKQLRKYLYSRIDVIGMHNNVDQIERPSKLFAIANAFKTSQSEPPTSFQELREATQALVDGLDCIDEKQKEEDFLFNLRDFCIALSNYSMTAKWNFYDDYNVDDIRRITEDEPS